MMTTFGISDYDVYWKKRISNKRTYKTEIHQKLIKAASEYTRNNGNILDVGVGPGHVFRELSKTFRCFGIEFSDEAFKLYDFPTTNIIKHDLRKGFPIFPGVSTFDTIIISHVIHHMENPEQIIREASGLMNSNSTLIIATPNTVFLPLRIKYLLFAQFPALSPGHRNFLTPYEYLSVFDKIGIEVKKIETTGKYGFLSRLFPFIFSGTIIFICGKKISNL